MANEYEILTQRVAEFREAQVNEVKTEKPKSPYGAKIHQLNMAWGETKKAHMAKLIEEEERYKSEVKKYLDLNAQWESDNRQQTVSANRGRPRVEWPDEVKMAAAAMIRADHKKSVVRAVLGISRTARLDELLREGEELLQVEELKARDQKQDQATGEEW